MAAGLFDLQREQAFRSRDRQVPIGALEDAKSYLDN